jgi:hypothetical protein
MADDKRTLAARIVMEDPLPGVTFAVQRGAAARAQLLEAVVASSRPLHFDIDLLVDGSLPDGRPRLTGPFVQGPPQARFVYLCVGEAAGQVGSEWRRRVKVPLGGLSWALIRSVPQGGRVEARIAGRARDGGPACASVPLLPPGWRLGD